jgi:maleylacetate reductase
MATGAFVHQGSPQRVVFGAGALAAVSDEARRLGIRRALVLSTPGHRDAAERVAGLLGEVAAGLFAGATMHTPVAVTEAALANVRDMGIDGAIAIGGGSTIGLGKAIAVRTDLPQIAIPTTYAGSEATDILGETTEGGKTTRRDPRVLPETVIYDVDLTLSLPPAITAASGMNAIAHAVEGLYARNASPVLRLMAEDGIRALAAALPRIAAAPEERDARSDALYGAWTLRTTDFRGPEGTR